MPTDNAPMMKKKTRRYVIELKALGMFLRGSRASPAVIEMYSGPVVRISQPHNSAKNVVTGHTGYDESSTDDACNETLESTKVALVDVFAHGTWVPPEAESKGIALGISTTHGDQSVEHEHEQENDFADCQPKFSFTEERLWQNIISVSGLGAKIGADLRPSRYSSRSR